MGVALLEQTSAEIAEAVSLAGGAEVFFGANVDADGWICGVEVLARGDREEVPAVLYSLDLWDLVIHNHPGGDLRPSKADLSIASFVAQEGKGFAIVDNTGTRMYVVVEPPLAEEAVQVDPAEVEAFFADKGPLARCVGEYEKRDGQLSMALSVLESFNKGGVTAVEAGTGSGKSFAYLVPAILYAKANRIRVIVATGTINLQEQLTCKDLPLLQKAFALYWKEHEEGGAKEQKKNGDGAEDTTFCFSRIKGRANYVCLRRVEELKWLPEELLKYSEKEQDVPVLREIIKWAGTTADGSLSDLSFQPSADVWEQVLADGDSCLGPRCECFSKCFYFKARFQAARSAILVVNHHLFFADLAIRRESGNYEKTFVLPGWRRVIFDEAHQLEAAASSFFGVTITQRGFLRRLGRLRSDRDPDKGQLPLLCERLMKAGETDTVADIQERLLPLIQHTRGRIRDVFSTIQQRVHSSLQNQSNDISALRYTGADDPWELLFSLCRDLASEFKELKKNARYVYAQLEDRVSGLEKFESTLAEFQAICRRLDRMEKEMLFFADKDEEDQVRWIEMKKFREHPYVMLKSAPFLVSKDLKDALWGTVKTAVLTSATLSVDNRIEYLAERLGFDDVPENRFLFLQVPSPFDWKKQSVLYVPNDTSQVSTAGFIEELCDWIVGAVPLSGGGFFLLFTSYVMLRRVFDATRDRLEAAGIEVFQQGTTPRGRLLEMFTSSGNGVLFGTESFWQGVDVRGKALSCVVIVKLPFAVPTEPLQVARMEEVRSRGRNPFRDYSLPQAVLKLRQGAGRLIRSCTDRGIIVVFDNRILYKSYGRVFLNSLPPFEKISDSRDGLLLRFGRFFASADADPSPAEKSG